jgi:hypothetical protein
MRMVSYEFNNSSDLDYECLQQGAGRTLNLKTKDWFEMLHCWKKVRE